MSHHGQEDGEKLGGVNLQPDGETLEHGVDRDGEQEGDGPQAGVLGQRVGHVGVVRAMSIPSVVSLMIQKNRMYRFHFLECST